jgi:hypothetical protein
MIYEDKISTPVTNQEEPEAPAEETTEEETEEELE